MLRGLRGGDLARATERGALMSVLSVSFLPPRHAWHARKDLMLHDSTSSVQLQAHCCGYTFLSAHN
jgi:hypothetical protein